MRRGLRSGGIPADILQENLGQGDPRTTARYFRAQIERRQAAMEGVFGNSRTVSHGKREEQTNAILKQMAAGDQELSLNPVQPMSGSD